MFEVKTSHKIRIDRQSRPKYILSLLMVKEYILSSEMIIVYIDFYDLEKLRYNKTITPEILNQFDIN